MPRWMISCQQYSELISNAMDRPLSFRERILARIHTWICPPCTYVQRQFSLIRQACRWMPADKNRSAAGFEDEPHARGVLPPEVCARMQAKIKEMLKKRF